jgi:hypothetical protein
VNNFFKTKQEMESLTTGCDPDLMTSHPPDVWQWQKNVDTKSRIGENVETKYRIGENVEKVLIDKKEICHDERKSFVRVLNVPLSFEKAGLLCSQLGGKLYYPEVSSVFVSISAVKLVLTATSEQWPPVNNGKAKSGQANFDTNFD